jgi:hypothetical protein
MTTRFYSKIPGILTYMLFFFLVRMFFKISSNDTVIWGDIAPLPRMDWVGPLKIHLGSGFGKKKQGKGITVSYRMIFVRSGKETFSELQAQLVRQTFFAVPYRTVHFLSSICFECKQLCSFCQVLITLGYVGGPYPPY